MKVRSEKEEEGEGREEWDSVLKSCNPTLTRWGANRKTVEQNYVKMIKSACFGGANIHSLTNQSTT